MQGGHPHNFSLSESNVWSDSPTEVGLQLYSVVVPIICGFGVIFNILNIAVFSKMNGSAYTYLTVLSGADWVSCLLIILSGLARGIFWGDPVWIQMDALYILPVGGVFSALSICATVAVALERLLFLRRPHKPGRHCLSCPTVARRIMVVCTVFSIMFNIPYLFIYDHTPSDIGILDTNEFFESTYYCIHNWLKFIIFCLLPSIFLTVTNGILIRIIHRAFKQTKSAKQLNQCRARKRIHDQVRLTITLVAVVCLFLLGEVPSHLASRKSAITLLYLGDLSGSNSTELETFRVVATVLNAIHVSGNFVLYCILNPPFFRELGSILNCNTERGKTKDQQLRVFIVQRAKANCMEIKNNCAYYK